MREKNPEKSNAPCFPGIHRVFPQTLGIPRVLKFKVHLPHKSTTCREITSLRTVHMLSCPSYQTVLFGVDSNHKNNINGKFLPSFVGIMKNSLPSKRPSKSFLASILLYFLDKWRVFEFARFPSFDFLRFFCPSSTSHINPRIAYIKFIASHGFKLGTQAFGKLL